MFKIRIAELNIEIDNKYPFSESFCKEFLAEFQVPDLCVSVSDTELADERAADPYGSTDGYLECICIYRKIALQLPRFDGMVFHASCVSLNGRCYAFAARSGTGKSTHTALWLKAFGDRCHVVNGDKPIFRRIAGEWRAFGTPWRGKEGMGGNTSAPLAAICFLERGSENRIGRLDGSASVARLFSQVLLPTEREAAEKQLALLDSLVTSIPQYLLFCNMEQEAATVAYEGMLKGANDEKK